MTPVDNARDLLMPCVPQMAGEALAMWGEDVIECEGHVWDNRTTPENGLYLLGRLHALAPLPGDPHDT